MQFYDPFRGLHLNAKEGGEGGRRLWKEGVEWCVLYCIIVLRVF